MKGNNGKEMGGLRCLLCDRVLTNRCSMRIHYMDLHYDDGTVYQCPTCSSVYKTRNTLKKHISTAHRGIVGVDTENCKQDPKD